METKTQQSSSLVRLARVKDRSHLADKHIAGAGQAGLTVGARLKMLGVDTLLIDKERRVGDNWRRRYRHLTLHDPVHMDHMPYVRFPESWPTFSSKDQLADFFEAYGKLLELNVWTRTNLESARYDDDARKWTVVLKRTKADGNVESRTLHPNHIVQATGVSGESFVPSISDMNDFSGPLMHSTDFVAARPTSQKKKAVLVGACNSAHDIAQDYYENGYEVTMVQRSSTNVNSSDFIVNVLLSPLYREAGPDVEDADLLFWSTPSEPWKTQHVAASRAQQEHDKTLLQGLEKAGFKLDKGPSDAGLFVKYFQRGGGYYIDVGTSQLIIDGKIKVKQGHEITRVFSDGLELADGSKLKADEIVFATGWLEFCRSAPWTDVETGYQSPVTTTRKIFGDKVADRISNVWGFDAEGEMQGIWRPSGHPGFWVMGGNFMLCRYYSRILALQIKATEEGLVDA